MPFSRPKVIERLYHSRDGSLIVLFAFNALRDDVLSQWI